MLTESQAKEVVEEYLANEQAARSTQEMLRAGAIPRLKEYVVKSGKVSDSIFGGKINDDQENPSLNTQDEIPLRLMVRTDEISTHDIRRGPIPFKDQVLAGVHNYMRRQVIDVIGTSQFEVPGLSDEDPVIASENLKQIPIENVLRAYNAKSSTSTSLYQHWKNGRETFCGHTLPADLIPNGPLPYVMDTPSTKSDIHDESISPDNLERLGICSRETYTHLRNSSLVAFGRISQLLRNRGIILVDTKTEHGINKAGEIVSQDELYTPDSSRFWLLKNYGEQWEKLKNGEIEELNPVSYSKEFARGFSVGEEPYNQEQRSAIAVRYIMAYQHLLEKEFVPDMRQRDEKVITGLQTALEHLVE